ncbi:hypothetical protein YDYSY3_57780 [Paenibacillus chitinolyticus]|uniref:DUF6148 family protein n=1 Tax=Paenibacillus chitinolyticus TaxID=79263 RepID=UPI0026E4C14B|nr:DUF6148 family protein [Paenibacillus chitinolyticus]GKS14778.1 hypothetical protein YDYSY3_57780 [Paenibacillus chitinolyticus]
MGAWTLAEAEVNLADWKAALRAISTGQSYSIAGRSLTRVNLKECKEMIEYFGKEIDKLTLAAAGRTRRRTRQYVPYDL